METNIQAIRRKGTLQKARQTLSRLQTLQEEVEALKRQVAQMQTYHVPQSLAELKPRRQPPAGKTAMEMIQGQWPGDETTEELLTQLKGLA